MVDMKKRYENLITDYMVYPSFYNLKYLFKNKKTLDIGCGYGYYLKYFNKESSGIDLSIKNISKTKSKGFKAKIGDINKKVGFNDCSFDAILLSHVLEHVTSPLNSLLEVNRLLKKNGLLLIGLPIEGGLINYFDRYFKDHPGHIYSFSLENIKVLGKETSFKMKGVYFDYPLMRRNKFSFIIIKILNNLLPTFINYKIANVYWVIFEK